MIYKANQMLDIHKNETDKVYNEGPLGSRPREG